MAYDQLTSDLIRENSALTARVAELETALINARDAIDWCAQECVPVAAARLALKLNALLAKGAPDG